VFSRIVNRKRPVVVLFAGHKVARKRHSVGESDFKLDLFRRKSGVAGKVAIWSSALLTCSVPSRSADRARERCPAVPHHSIAASSSLLREVMREQLRLGCSSGGKLIAQNLTRAAVQSWRRLLSKFP